MTAEQNKNLIYQFVDCINNKDWVQLEKLVHDDYGEYFTPEDLANELKFQTVEKFAKIRIENSPLLTFLRLAGFPEEIISETFRLGASTNIHKQGFIQLFINISNILINWEIIDIVADEEQVWYEGENIINDPYQRNIIITGLFKFKIKDNQIVSYRGWGRFYAALIQFGKIVMDRNKKEEVQHYIQVLKDMGIIPP